MLNATLQQNFNETSTLSTIISNYSNVVNQNGRIENILNEVYGEELLISATTITSIALETEDGDSFQTWVLLNGTRDILDWTEQSIPGENIDTALESYEGLTFSAGESAAYILDIWGSGI